MGENTSRKKKKANEYFTRLFRSSHPEQTEELLQGFAPRVTQRMNMNMTREVTDSEIRRANFFNDFGKLRTHM